MDPRLLELFESSSENEELIFMAMNSMNSKLKQAYDLVYETKNHRQSVSNFEEVIHNYTDEEFRQHFRLSRKTAAILTEKFANSIHFKRRLNSSGRKDVSAEIQCLSFLWFAGNKESYREVGNLFGICTATAYRNQTQFLEFLFDISPSYIKMPSSSSMKEKISQEFERLAGFKNVLGCIDGSYIYIRKPVHKIRSTYINRHGLLSITLQGICDANKVFLDVFVGATSKIHDARVFKLSHIYNQLPRICEDKYHLLGDAAYPIRRYLLTPYRDYGDLSEQQKKYNKKHSATRVKIENCFGLLKQRFRQLTRLDYYTVERMSKFVLGCCVLHNLCIVEGDLWEDEMTEQNSTSERNLNSRSEGEDDEILEAVLRSEGETKRNQITSSI